MKRTRRLALLGVIAAATTACTTDQIARWHEWHAQDPAAAEAFANQPDVQANLQHDWDQDGVIEPDPVTKPATKPKPTAKPAATPTARAQASSSGGGGNSGVNWDAVARCESGGQWSHGNVQNKYGSFGGGLMIMQSAWNQFGGSQFASTPGGASKAEQIIVAERIAARVGASRAWQCPTPSR